MEFAINGHHYRSTKLNAIDAYHLSRRYVVPLYNVNALESELPEEKAKALVIASNQVSEADANYVIEKCLSVTVRQTTGGAGWAPLWSSAGLMQQDLSLNEMMQIIYHVLEDNKLFSFFDAPSSTSVPEAGANKSS